MRKRPGARHGAPLQPRDLTPGDHDVPPFSLGGQDMYAISPDGQEVAYTSNIDEVEATSTNEEIFTVPITQRTARAKKISTSPGDDTTPLYPDGRNRYRLAFASACRFRSRRTAAPRAGRRTGEDSRTDRGVGSISRKLHVVDMANSTAFPLTAEDHGQCADIWELSSEPERTTVIANPREMHADDLSKKVVSDYTYLSLGNRSRRQMKLV